MSLGDDERRKDYDSDVESSSASPPKTVPVPLPKQIQHSKGNGIWSTPSLGSYMQCDTCLGAGILPIPTDTPKDLLPNPAMIIKPTNNSNTLLPNINQKPFVTGQLKSSLAISNEKAADEQKDEEHVSVSRESVSTEMTKPASIWSDRIRRVENKWDIVIDENKSFAQRVEAIESKALFCRSVLQNSSKSSVEENAADIHSLRTEGTLKEVELAEEKWGLSPPEGYNLTERIQLIEQTAYSFIKRLELWL